METWKHGLKVNGGEGDSGGKKGKGLVKNMYE